MENLKSEIINAIGFTPSKSKFQIVQQIFEKTAIEHALELTQGSQLAAARMMGINRNTMTKKVKIYGIDFRKYRASRPYVVMAGTRTPIDYSGHERCFK